MNKFKNILVVTAITSSLIVTPVLATPSVNEIKQNKAEAEQQLEKANDKLETLLTEFAVLKSDIKKQEKLIEKADQDLQKAKAEEERQYQDMLLRIKFMYEKGEESDVAALLGAVSFSDMINQAEYIKSVHTYDRKMLNEYKKAKDKVAEAKTELEDGKADMVLMADTYKEQEKELNATIDTMKDKVADFDAQLAEAKRKAEEEARRLAEETRRAEEAAKRAEEEAKKQQDQNKKPSKPNNKPSKPANPSKPNKPTNPDKPNKPVEPEKPAEKPSNGSKGQQIANTGLKYVGNKYVYGGNSLTNGIDCSGFTQQIHSLCGIGGLPRTSRDQRFGGKAVSGLSNALPGDVICYDGHVALYLGGNRIVHASNPSPYPKGGIKTGTATYRTILAIRRYW